MGRAESRGFEDLEVARPWETRWSSTPLIHLRPRCRITSRSSPSFSAFLSCFVSREVDPVDCNSRLPWPSGFLLGLAAAELQEHRKVGRAGCTRLPSALALGFAQLSSEFSPCQVAPPPWPLPSPGSAAYSCSVAFPSREVEMASRWC